MSRGAFAAVVGLLVAVFGVVLAAWVVPTMVDPGVYRAEIARTVRTMTGRELVIDGDVRLRLLPEPLLEAGGVRLANPPGAGAPDMMRLRALVARISLGPLLRGRVVVNSLELIEPAIVVERLADGRWNWRFGQEADVDEMIGGVREFADDLAVKRVTVTSGRLAWTDGTRGEQVVAINAELTADTLTGPFRVQGEAMWRDLPWRVDATLGQLASGAATPLTILVDQRGNGEIRLTQGRLVNAPGVPRLEGRLRIDLARAAEALRALTGYETPDLGQRLQADGPVFWRSDRVAIGPLAVRLGEARATATLQRGGDDGGPAIALDVATIDLDRWPGVAFELANAAALLSRLSHDWPGAWRVAGEAMRWRDATLRALVAEIDARPDHLAVARFAARLPGDTETVVSGEVALGPAPRFQGGLDIGTESARMLAEWLGWTPPVGDGDRWRRLTATADLMLDGGSLGVERLNAQLDGSRVTGAARVGLGPRPALGINLAVDRLPLEPYLPAGFGIDGFAHAASRVDANVALRIDALTVEEAPAMPFALRATLLDGRLRLASLAFGADEDRLEASGAIRFDGDEAIELSVNGRLRDVRPWLRAGGWPAAAVDPGRGTLAGRVTGTLGAPRVDVAFTAADQASYVVSLGLDRALRATGLRLGVAGPRLAVGLIRAVPELPLILDRSAPIDLLVDLRRADGGWRLTEGRARHGRAELTFRGVRREGDKPFEGELDIRDLALDLAQVIALADLARGRVGELPVGRLTIAATNLAAAGIPVDRLSASLRATPEGVTLADMTASVWGGAVLARGQPFAEVPNLTAVVRDLDVAQVARRFDWGDHITGRLSAALRLTIGAQATPIGRGRFEAELDQVPGFDLAGAAASLPEGTPTPDRIDALVADFRDRFEQGVARAVHVSGGLVMDADGFAVEDALLAWSDGMAAAQGRRAYRDGATRLDLRIRPARLGLPGFEISVSRAAEGTRRVFDLTRLDAMLAGR
jgi:hypothetical protein